MKRHPFPATAIARTAVTTALAAAATATVATATPVDIPNASFEERENFDPFFDSFDKYPQWGLESWRHFEVDNNGGPLRIWNPGPADLTDAQGALDIGFGGDAPDGDYVMLVRSRYNDDEFHDPPQPREFEAAVQLLEATFDPTKSYTLTASVGQPPGSDNYTPDWFGYALQIAVGGTAVDGARFAGHVVGGTVIAEDRDSVAVPVDTWVTASVTYLPDPAHADLAGLPLQVRLCALENPADHSLTGWVAFDDVSLEATRAGPSFIPVDIARAAGGDLRLTWSSEPGLLYNLVQSPDLVTWSPLANDLPATPDTNAFDLPAAADPDLYYRVEAFPKPPVTVFTEAFDAADALPAGWTTATYGADSGTTTWDVGDPAGGPGPPAATSGTRCAGTNLLADYGTTSETALRSAPVDLTQATAATLTFQQWVDMDNFDREDIGTVRVLDAGDLPGTVTVLGVVRTNIQGLQRDGGDGWTTFARGIPAAALGKNVVVEFVFKSDFVTVDDASGWYIDDIAISADLP